MCESEIDSMKKRKKENKKYLHDSYLIGLLSFKICRAKYFSFFFFSLNQLQTHTYLQVYD